LAAAWAAGADEAGADEAGADEAGAEEAGALGGLAAWLLAVALTAGSRVALCVEDGDGDEQAETASPRPASEVPKTSVNRDDRAKFMIVPVR
jgi:hypothetical protein